MGRGVVDLMTFLDVCQLYLQTRRKSRNLCTLWAIVTFIRTEDTGEFLRWCRAYTIPYLRYRNASSGNKEKQRVDKLILKALQELFYCGCSPPSDLVNGKLWQVFENASVTNSRLCSWRFFCSRSALGNVSALHSELEMFCSVWVRIKYVCLEKD